MLEIQEVTEDMVPLARKFLAGRPEFGYSDNWDPLFKYDWKLKQFPYGHVLVDNGNIRGFHGTIFSERTINGKNAIMCCLSTWVADINCPRGSGRSLQAPLHEMKEVTLMAHTPNIRSTPACLKLGFDLLEQEQIAVPVLSHYFIGRFNRKHNLYITFDKEEIGNHLQANEGEILADHKNLECLHFLIEDRNTGHYCYGIATQSIIRKKYLPPLKSFNLCYLSDAELFADNINSISEQIHALRYDLIRYDSRLIRRRISLIEYRFPRIRVFKSNTFQNWELDNLYSELVTWNRY